jgi:hypothetical protein
MKGLTKQYQEAIKTLGEGDLGNVKVLQAAIIGQQKVLQEQREAINRLLAEMPAAERANILATQSVSDFTDEIAAARFTLVEYNTQLQKIVSSLQSAVIRIDNIRPLMRPVPIEDPTVTEKAFGGMVSRGTDSILALLSPGEFVVNAAASRRFYSQLVAMNSAIPGFAAGGPVTNVTGDFNIHMNSSGNATADVQEIGRLLKREIRRGTISLS